MAHTTSYSFSVTEFLPGG